MKGSVEKLETGNTCQSNLRRLAKRNDHLWSGVFAAAIVDKANWKTKRHLSRRCVLLEFKAESLIKLPIGILALFVCNHHDSTFILSSEVSLIVE